LFVPQRDNYQPTCDHQRSGHKPSKYFRCIYQSDPLGKLGPTVLGRSTSLVFLKNATKRPHRDNSTAAPPEIRSPPTFRSRTIKELTKAGLEVDSLKLSQ
jgi:hypothetical protein